MSVPRGDAVALAKALVRVDSRNPSLVPGAAGEGAVARTLADVLDAWGFDVELQEVAQGRPNVIARTGGDGRTLLLNGHLDVVGTDAMVHAPFDADERDGRIYGRGSTDMKAGVAAMCAAAVRARDAGASTDVLITAVVDEEFESLGTSALVARGLAADAAIVTEPTRLAIAPAHKGFAWVEVIVQGKSAHGSRYDVGVDAILHAGLILGELDALERGHLGAITHPLLGRASLHVGTVHGGTAWSVYPDRCVLRVERRTVPGEPASAALHEVQDAVARVRSRRPEVVAEVVPIFSQAPSDVAVDAPVVRALRAALEAEGEGVRVEGLSAWTDAALLNAAGIPAICFGPGDIALAHAAEEYVVIDEIERATRVLTRLIGTWSRERGS
jgi:acetylornithine deacetylase